MENNRIITRFAIVVISLACVITIVNSIACFPENPIRTAFVALASFIIVLLAGLLVMALLNSVIFIPLLMLLARLQKPDKETEKDAQQPNPCVG